MADAKYSRTNGALSLVVASGLFGLVVLEGYDGNSTSAIAAGLIGLFVGLQGLDDLVWKGSQDPILVPLKRVAGGLAVACLALLVLGKLI